MCPTRSSGPRIHSELTLGTAQLGLEYGIVNHSGKPPIVEAIAMVRYAVAHGVATLDTARAYGDSERVIGEALSGAWCSRAQAVTKLDPLASFHDSADSDTVRQAVEKSVYRSCEALRSKRLGTLLLHRWLHRRSWKGAAWQCSLDLRDSGLISILGASVYEPAEALDALQDPAIQHLQIPVNVLDGRWKRSGIASALAARPDVIVHGRSAFLQGILLHPVHRWPLMNDYDAGLCIQLLRQDGTAFFSGKRRRPLSLLCALAALDYQCSCRVRDTMPTRRKPEALLPAQADVGTI